MTMIKRVNDATPAPADDDKQDQAQGAVHGYQPMGDSLGRQPLHPGVSDSAVHVSGNSDGSCSGACKPGVLVDWAGPTVATDNDALALAKLSAAAAKVERMTCGSSGGAVSCEGHILRGLPDGDYRADDLRAAVHDSMARADAAAQRGDGNPPASKPWHPNGTVAGLEALASGQMMTLEEFRQPAQSAEAHRQALEFAAVPELALAVAQLGSPLDKTNARQIGTAMRDAIDGLLGVQRPTAAQ